MCVCVYYKQCVKMNLYIYILCSYIYNIHVCIRHVLTYMFILYVYNEKYCTILHMIWNIIVKRNKIIWSYHSHFLPPREQSDFIILYCSDRYTAWYQNDKNRFCLEVLRVENMMVFYASVTRKHEMYTD